MRRLFLSITKAEIVGNIYVIDVKGNAISRRYLPRVVEEFKLFPTCIHTPPNHSLLKKKNQRKNYIFYLS